MLDVHHAPVEQNSASEKHIVHLIHEWFVEGLPAEGRIEAKVKLDNDVEEVLVEVVDNDESDTAVCLTTMVEEQGLKELELTNGVVAGTCSLHSLLSSDSNTHVRLQDHCDVVGTISYRQSHLSREPDLDHLDDISFLLRADTTGNHHFHLRAGLQESLYQVI